MVLLSQGGGGVTLCAREPAVVRYIFVSHPSFHTAIEQWNTSRVGLAVRISGIRCLQSYCHARRPPSTPVKHDRLWAELDGTERSTGHKKGLAVWKEGQRGSIFDHSPPVPVFAPPHQTIWSIFSQCLRIWPILCTQFMMMAWWLEYFGLCNVLCTEGLRSSAVYLGDFPR